MSTFSWLEARTTQRLFEHGNAGVPLELVRATAARILWLNRGAAVQDPEFTRLGSDFGKYEQHLLDCCAYQLPEVSGGSGAFKATGFADRYGGTGIGLNGGSGRACFVNGYHVKGVGRTPLVSNLTEMSHASGGAYLEESVRDIVFTEVVRAEFPHSAVPVIALIDTGQTQTFEFPTHTDVESRVLVVRPPFLRPAHFVRSSFVSADPKEGIRDARRVEAMFDFVRRLRGDAAFIHDYELFYERWAQQLAYGYVHRLSHGSPTLSNITLDAQLLDFGAATALPSWADIAFMMARQPFVAHVEYLPRTMRHAAYFFGRHLSAKLASDTYQDAFCTRLNRTFKEAVLIEALRLLGLERLTAQDQVRADWEGWWKLIMRLIAYFERERADMMENTPKLHVAWDVDLVWSSRPPAHLSALRERLLDCVPTIEHEACALRSAMLARPRPTLYRHDLRSLLFNALRQGRRAVAPERASIELLVDQLVVDSRRDSRHILTNTVSIGFAIRAGQSLAIVRRCADGTVWAMEEAGVEPAEARRVSRWSESVLHFDDPAQNPFEGAVLETPVTIS